jgi:hypothetical protein
MSRVFIGFGQQPYIGQPGAQAIKLGGISGSVIPLLFQWLSYGASSVVPNINVLVDLNGAACRSLDQIRSVYIDNLGSANPVYVYFPDTGYTIAAKANSEGWYPAFTNGRTVWVVGEGFLTGSIPQTFVLLSNVPMPPAVNTELDQAASLWLASPVISRGTSIYNSRLGIPALGDQFFATTFDPTFTTGIVPLWNTPYASGFIYITSLIITAFAFQTAAPFEALGQLTIESTGIAGTLIQPIFMAQNPPANTATISITGMQIKLDATQTWRLRVSIGAGNNGGIASITSTFTQQP